MLKVKEWLDKNNLSPTMINIVEAIKATETKTLTITLITGLKFTIEQISRDILTNSFMTFDHVFIDGIYYKEFITINTEHIVCYYG